MLDAALAVGEVDVEQRGPLVESVVEPVGEQPLGALAPAASPEGCRPPAAAPCAPAARASARPPRQRGQARAGRARSPRRGDERERGDGGLVERRQLGRYVSSRLSRIDRARRARGNRTEHPRQHTPRRRSASASSLDQAAQPARPRARSSWRWAPGVLGHGRDRLELGLAAELRGVRRAGLERAGRACSRAGTRRSRVRVDQLAPPCRRARRGSGSRRAPPGCAPAARDT